MSGMRQKIQYSLALEPVDQGETPISGYQGTEPFVAKPRSESPASAEQQWRRCATEEISKERGNAFAATRVALASMG